MIETAFRERLGRRLEHVYFEEHEPREKFSPSSVLSVWLEFTGLPLLHIFGSPDGWRLCADDVQPGTTVEMNEYGRIEVVAEPRSGSILSDVIGSRLSRFWTIRSSDHDDVVGLRLKFGDADIYILNWADDLHIGYDYPPGMTRAEVRELAGH